MKETSDNLNAIGKAAWEAYKEAVGGVAWNGDSLPTWEEMLADESKQKLVIAWETAGVAAAEEWLASATESL